MSSTAEPHAGMTLPVPPDARRARLAARGWAAVWAVIGRLPAGAVDPSDARIRWRVVAGVAVLNGVCLVLNAVAQGMGRAGQPQAGALFWTAMLVMVFGSALAASRPGVHRLERLACLVVLGQSLHLLKVIFSPIGFYGFDEYLHYRTLLDIVELQTLFASNSLLPISPLYPGLEIAVAPLIALTGLAPFPAALLGISLTRFVAVMACFLMFERISGSSRLAAIAVLVVMSGTSFVGFHGQFAYETLAFALFLVVIGCVLRLEQEPPSMRWQFALVALLLIPVVTVTHHLTSYLTAATIVGVAVLMLARPMPGQPRALVLLLAVVAVAAPPLWKSAVSAPMSDYLGPHIMHALSDMQSLLLRGSPSRTFFVGTDGVQAPLALRLMGVISVVMIGVGLFFGFFRALTFRLPGEREARKPRRPWPSSASVLLALAGAAFPVTVIFKMTSTGWEVGNRLGAFAMIGAGFVCALSVTHFWGRSLRGRTGRTALAGVLALMIAGGIVNGGALLVRTSYQVSADGQSLEPLGIAVAGWMRQVLGENNRVVADRTNSILASTYGRQNVLSTLNGDPAIADLYFGDRLGAHERNIIAAGFVDYILVDLRLPMSAPKFGHYYEPGDLSQYDNLPPRQRDLAKFERHPEIARVLDAGPVVVYDVRKIRR
ncbi:hypothetical protein ARD30_08600 [Bosea thiooxidans]|uniref:4-amino-4-deoxy-L-arabinose transferase n=1 Tax=Bosea thiooxidans TaxID=53254 RepID=A0A0Q3M7Y3_9HYPH|nr:hypothetical protein [Bosea thiooxidans]KQK31905.1 hypothetical protein ARD30_08600 [Bosea thiooxidans]SKB51301.1 hypothetical protein SAMN05660750_01075 [Bosea thiooxidans]